MEWYIVMEWCVKEYTVLQMSTIFMGINFMKWDKSKKGM